MEESEIEVTAEDHLDRCRLCLKFIGDSDIVYKVSEATKTKFEKLTSLSLEISHNFSLLICVNCNRDLNKFNVFRDDLVRKQSKLYEIIYGEIVCEEQPEPEHQTEEQEQVVQEDVLEQEENNLANVEGEMIDEEIMDCDGYLLEDEAMQIESLVEESDGNDVATFHFVENTPSNTSRKISRPKAWTWTRQMEIDLIRYRNKYKTEKTSDNAVHMKISKKFVAKGYPNISRKSIKYKFEKLYAEGRIQELEADAALNVVESDFEEEITMSEKKTHSKKKFSHWDEEMEILLLNLVNRLRLEHPAKSENSIFRRVARDLQREGYTNLTEHIVLYHHRKLKQNEEKYQKLMEKSRELDEMPSDNWSRAAESAMVYHHNKIRSQYPTLKPLELYTKIKSKLAGHGNFSEISIRNRFLSVFHEEDHDQSDQAVDTGKRNYLYWTEEMKDALIRYREIVKQSSELTELWENVAKMMRDNGFGDFTADNVKYKYFNLKRGNRNLFRIESIDQDEV